MEITIKVETEKGTEEIILTDEPLNNSNYVNVIVDGKEYQVPVRNLFLATKVFEEQRKEDL